MKPAPFAYYLPTSVTEAVSLLAKLAPDDGRVIAGGQTLVPMMAFRLARPRHVIDINKVAELGVVTIDGGAMSIGATVRHCALENPIPESGQLGRLLADVVRNIAHPPIRTRGTFCGSVANADPASEWCLVTATLGAEMVLRSTRGERIVPARDFYTGIMSNALEPDELIARVRIPLLADNARFGFHEVSRRRGDFAMASALVVYRSSNGRALDARVGVGAVEPSPRRVAAAEEALSSGMLGPDLFRRTAAACAGAVDPLDDPELTAEYRRQLVQAVVERALERSAG